MLLDSAIEELNNYKKLKEQEAKQQYSKIMIITGKNDVVEAYKDIREFINNPDHHEFSFQLESPVEFRSLLLKLERGQKINGLNISLVTSQ